MVSQFYFKTTIIWTKHQQQKVEKKWKKNRIKYMEPNQCSTEKQTHTTVWVYADTNIYTLHSVVHLPKFNLCGYGWWISVFVCVLARPFVQCMCVFVYENVWYIFLVDGFIQYATVYALWIYASAANCCACVCVYAWHCMVWR